MKLPLESYYRDPIVEHNDLQDLQQTLRVNCCGRLAMNHHFHTHIREGRNDFYLLYMWQGRMRLNIGNHTPEGSNGIEPINTTIEAGEMVLITPHMDYAYENIDGEIVYYWIHFTGYDAASIVDQLSLCSGVLAPGLYDGVAAMFAELFTEFILRDRRFEIATQAQLMNILLELSRRSSKQYRGSHLRQTKIATSLQFIHQNIAYNISIPQLADMEHLSSSRYRNVFRECMGVTPSDYIISLRLHKACELMDHFDMTISEAANSVGYSDPLYFSRLFKKKFGMNPSSYLARRI